METKCRVVLFGECMIELRGQMFGTMQQNFGGDTLNTAVYLARLGSDSGIEVAFATELGTDAYSDAMLAAWEKERVDTSLVLREAGRMPGLYTIQVDAAGERTFYYWRDSSAAKHYFDGPGSPLEDRLETVDVLYFSGISLAVLSPEARTRLFECADRLRTRGGRVMFDNNYRARLWSGGNAEAQVWYEQAYGRCDLALITPLIAPAAEIMLPMALTTLPMIMSTGPTAAAMRAILTIMSFMPGERLENHCAKDFNPAATL